MSSLVLIKHQELLMCWMMKNIQAEVIMSTIYVWIIAMFVISIIIAVIRPMIKGKVGEAAVSLLLKQLASDKYKIVNDVILSSEGGNTSTTQIDHIVVSVYGIFSIETKNYKGWICGTENAKQWTQSIYGHKYKFMNPIHQNYAHVKALESMLRSNGYEAVPIYSISHLVFVPNVEVN